MEFILDFCLPRTSQYVITQAAHVAGETVVIIVHRPSSHLPGELHNHLLQTHYVIWMADYMDCCCCTCILHVLQG